MLKAGWKFGGSGSAATVCSRIGYGLVLAALGLVTGCGGGNGDATDAPTPTEPQGTSVPGPVATTTVISGKATFQRVPQDPFTNGLRYNLTYSQPIRGAVAELVSTAGATLETTVTDAQGNFRFSTDTNQSVSIRVKAHMRATGNPSWDVTVVDNVNSDALYVLDSGAFSTSGATMTRNLEAASGWRQGAYSDVRAAGPFAILDTVYESMQKVVEADPDINFPELEINWSVNNRPTSGSFADGEIGSSLFRPSGGGREIYIVGAADADTDEYDPHVIAHEFTHFLHFHFGRSDSLGGAHSVGDRLDPRVAFGEGVATAFAAMFLDNPNYVDALGFDQASGVNMNIEDNNLRNKGWYNEGSVQAVIYDLFDATADEHDTLRLGFGPVYDALIGPLRDGVPLVTIHAYLDQLKKDHPAIANMIDETALGQQINTVDSDAYGRGESNSAARFDKVTADLHRAAARRYGGKRMHHCRQPGVWYRQQTWQPPIFEIQCIRRSAEQNDHHHGNRTVGLRSGPGFASRRPGAVLVECDQRNGANATHFLLRAITCLKCTNTPTPPNRRLATSVSMSA